MMESTQTITRWQEITALWNDNRWLYILAGVVLGILVTPALEQITGHLNDLIGNLVPEAVSVLFTILILDRLADNRATEQLKTRLIREAGSQSNETAKAAIDWMRAEGWLTANDDVQLLNGAYLRYAKLHEAYLKGAVLKEAYLWRANLVGANLREAILEAANLSRANLTRAYLRYANLKKTNLNSANLKDAILSSANLQDAELQDSNLEGVELWEANLRNALLDGAIFSENTALPDAHVMGWDTEDNKPIYDKYWTADTDMSRFTDPNHPDFWQPDWAKKRDDSE